MKQPGPVRQSERRIADRCLDRRPLSATGKLLFVLFVAFVAAFTFPSATRTSAQEGGKKKAGFPVAVTAPAPLGEKYGFFSLRVAFPREFLPPPTVKLPRKLLLLVDASASMGEIGLRQAALLVEAFLRATAREAAKNGVELSFSLATFDIEMHGRQKQFRRADDKNISAAVNFLHAVRPDGGTDTAKALRAAKALVGTGKATEVVLLTDGRPTFGETAPAALAEILGEVPLSAVKCGPVADNAFVSTLAAAGGGFTLLLPPKKSSGGAPNVEEKLSQTESAAVADFARRLFHPRLRNVSVKIEGVETRDIYPALPVTLAYTAPLTLWGRFRGTGKAKVVYSGQRIVTRAGKTRKETVRRHFTVSFSAPDRQSAAEKSPAWKWATARFADRADRLALLRLRILREGNKPTVEEWQAADAVEEELRELSTRWNFPPPRGLPLPPPVKLKAALEHFRNRNPYPLTSKRLFPRMNEQASHKEFGATQVAGRPTADGKRQANVRHRLNVLCDLRGLAAAEREGKRLFRKALAAAVGQSANALEGKKLREVFGAWCTFLTEAVNDRRKVEAAVEELIASAACLQAPPTTGKEAPNPYLYAAADRLRALGRPGKAAALWLNYAARVDKHLPDTARAAALWNAVPLWRLAGFESLATKTTAELAAEKTPAAVRALAVENLLLAAADAGDWREVERRAAVLAKLPGATKISARARAAVARKALEQGGNLHRALALTAEKYAPPPNTVERREYLRARAAVLAALGLLKEARALYEQDVRETLAARIAAAEVAAASGNDSFHAAVERLGKPLTEEFARFLRGNNSASRFCARQQRLIKETKSAVARKIRRRFLLEALERLHLWNDALALLDEEFRTAKTSAARGEAAVRAAATALFINSLAAAARRLQRLATRQKLSGSEVCLYAETLFLAGRLEEALRVADSLAGREHVSVGVLCRLAKFYRRAKAEKRARVALEKAWAADKGNAETAAMLAKEYAATGRIAEALRTLFANTAATGKWDGLFRLRRIIRPYRRRRLKAGLATVIARLKQSSEPREKMRLLLLEGELRARGGAAFGDKQPAELFAAFAAALRTAAAIQPEKDRRKWDPWEYVRRCVVPHKKAEARPLYELIANVLEASETPPARREISPSLSAGQNATRRLAALRLKAALLRQCRDGDKAEAEQTYRALLSLADDWETMQEALTGLKLLGTLKSNKKARETTLLLRQRFSELCRATLRPRFKKVFDLAAALVADCERRGRRDTAAAIALEAADSPNAPPKLRRRLLLSALEALSKNGGRPNEVLPAAATATKVLDALSADYFHAATPVPFPASFWATAKAYGAADKYAAAFLKRAEKARDRRLLETLLFRVFPRERTTERRRCVELLSALPCGKAEGFKRAAAKEYARGKSPRDLLKAVALQKELLRTGTPPLVWSDRTVLGDYQKKAGNPDGAIKTWCALGADDHAPQPTRLEAVRRLATATPPGKQAAPVARVFEHLLNTATTRLPWMLRFRTLQVQALVLFHRGQPTKAEAKLMQLIHVCEATATEKRGQKVLPEKKAFAAVVAAAAVKMLTASARRRKAWAEEFAAREKMLRVAVVSDGREQVSPARRALTAAVLTAPPAVRKKYLTEHAKAAQAKMQTPKVPGETAREATAARELFNALRYLAVKTGARKQAAIFAEAAAAAAETAAPNTTAPRTGQSRLKNETPSAAWRCAAEAYRELGDFASAERCADRACRRQPFVVENYLQRAEILSAEGKNDAALRATTTAVERLPRNRRALWAAARAFRKRKDFAAAEELLLRLLALNENDPASRLAYADLLRAAGRTTEAETWLKDIRGKIGGLPPAEMIKFRAEVEKRLRELRRRKKH